MILKDKKYIVLFLAPALVLVTVFLYFPLLLNTLISFTNLDTGVMLNKAEFIGFDNYVRLWDNFGVLKTIFFNTGVVLVGCLVFEIGIAMLLAFMIEAIGKGYKFYRTIFFFPVVISGAAIGLMFYLAYDYNYGLLNSVLTNIFGFKEGVVWLTEKSAIYLVLVPIVWQYVGFYFVIFLTAMSKIPTDIYESAMLDGITGIKKAIYITVPLMWDVIATSTALVIAGVMRVFDVPWVITGGGPSGSSELLSTYYAQSVGINNAYAAAIAALIVVLGYLLTKISNMLTERETITY